MQVLPLRPVQHSGSYMFSNGSNNGVGTYLVEAGQLIPFACDSVICPQPAVSSHSCASPSLLSLI